MFVESEFWVALFPWLECTALTLPAPSAPVFILKQLYLATVPAGDNLRKSITTNSNTNNVSGFSVYISIKCLYGRLMILAVNLHTVFITEINSVLSKGTEK